MDLIDPAMADQAPMRIRQRMATKQPPAIVRDHTITYYVDDIRPSEVPPFTFFVSGSAAGKVRMTAYIPAGDPTEAQIRLADYFPSAYVECVEIGRVEQAAPTGMGVVQPERRPGLFRRLFSL